MLKRDIRTLDTMSEEQLLQVQSKTIAVVGVGGLGGYVTEMIARLGIHKLILIDGDIFDETNLNRQILCSEHNLGSVKVHEAELRVKSINATIQVEAIFTRLTLENKELIKNVDCVIDCLDSVKSRLELEAICEEFNIPFVHGAVGGWMGQVTTVFPKDKTLHQIYNSELSVYKPIGAASFIPATIASYQVAECIKVLLNKKELLRHKILSFDLLNNDVIILDLKN